MNKLQQAAKMLDGKDALAAKVSEFALPENTIYLDGNSLGPLPINAKKRANEVVEQQWGNSLIESWNKHAWIDLPKTVGNKIAPLIGAAEGTVICCDSISVNLFKLLSSALIMQQNKRPQKRYVLSQNNNFPTDLYMAQGLSMLMGEHRCELLSVDAANIEATLQEQGNHIAVLMLTHVNFKHGDVFDIEKITALAHKQGVMVLWDLAHSAGVMPLHLAEHKVDFAVGCTYKYLNGGPGAPGFAYVAPQHLSSLSQPLSGWMGHKQPFAFAHDYQKADGVEQLLCGTPSIISMSVLDAALDVFDKVALEDIRQKSIALNQFFQECVYTLLNESASNHEVKTKKGASLLMACADDAKARGSQISFSHPDAYAICQALIAKHVIADFRAPNILRIGFSPLFLRFQDMYKAAKILVEIINNEEYTLPTYQIKQKVT